MAPLALLRRTVDDFLGPADRRFFSTGYRRVGYDFGAVFVDVRDGSDGSLSTRVGLTYPEDWSKKSEGVIQRPHLSTVDAIVLGIQMSELCLVQAFDLDLEQRRRMWVRAVRIRAGLAPEEELGEVGISVRLMETRVDQGPNAVSVVVSQIGSMRVRCEVVHAGSGGVQVGSARYANPAELLGAADTRYYGAGFTRGGHHIDNLVLDVPARTATAAVTVIPADAAEGVEGAYQPATTPVDCFVTGLQLAQVLLYEMDSMERATSNTLWMRATAIDMTEPHREVADRLPLTTSLRNVDLIEMNGGVWRTADIVAHLGSIRFTCAVTHQLPRGSEARLGSTTKERDQS
jgi:Pseudomonas avirulence D protein (AvrD)